MHEFVIRKVKLSRSRANYFFAIATSHQANQSQVSIKTADIQLYLADKQEEEAEFLLRMFEEGLVYIEHPYFQVHLYRMFTPDLQYRLRTRWKSIY